jgi:hypothetical protein
MTHFLRRFPAAVWKFCMVIVTVLVGVPGVDFSGDFLLLTLLIATAVTLRDMSGPVRRGGVALCAAAFAAVAYATWGTVFVQSEPSPAAVASVVLVLVGCTLIDRADVAGRSTALSFAAGGQDLPDYANLSNLRESGGEAGRQRIQPDSAGESLRKPTFGNCMPDVTVYVLAWSLVSRLGIWFPSVH